MKFVLVSLLAGLAVVLPSAEAQVGNGRIAFVGDPAPGNVQGVYTMNPDGTGRALLSRGASFPSWSPDGSKIAFRLEGTPSERLMVANADGTDARIVSTGDPVVPGSWSPESTRVAFLSGWDVYTADASGERVRRLTFDGRFKDGPIWSPSGSSIVYAGRPPGGLGIELFVVGVNGSGPVQITTTANSFRPAWSPTGSAIAFVQQDPPNSASQIAVIRPDGTGLHRVTGSSGSEGWPAWSPDGSKIAFASAENAGDCKYCSGSREIFVVDADGSNRRRLTELAPLFVEDAYPVWSPDGDQLLFTRNGDPTTMNADGTCEQALAQDGVPGQASWQPVPDRPPGVLKRCHAASVSVVVGSFDGNAFPITATIRNEGTEPLTRVVLRARPRSDLSLYSRGGQRCAAQVLGLMCRIDRLDRGAERTLHLVATARRVGRDRRGVGKGLRATFGVSAREDLLRTGRESGYANVTGISCSNRDRGRGVIVGSRFPDRICGRRGDDLIRPLQGRDVVLAGPGDDLVLTRDPSIDRISCGPGRDRVYADRRDVVSRDCEQVRRAG